MKNARSVFTLLLAMAFSVVSGQDFSNKGTDFWLGYGYHVNMSTNNQQEMVLYFTSDKNASVKVEIPALGYTATYSITANQVTKSTSIPKAGTQDARLNAAGLSNKGIHITSDVPVVAYAHIYNASVSGASLLFPTNTLGKEYYDVSFTQSTNATSGNSFFFVVATEDNTSVEITPSAANVNNLTVGQPAIITMNKGEVYNVMGTVSGVTGTDLTGSRIRSIATNGSVGCKKIAVFSGSGKMSIGGGTNGAGTGSGDNLFAQALPSVAWGKKYLTAPTGSQPNNFYRVCVTDPNTVVKLNGNVLPRASLINNFYYQFKNNNTTNPPAVPNLIESDIPVLVSQYCTTTGVEGNTGGGNGDPEMIYLSPVEQTINNITLYSASDYSITQSYINVIIKTEGVASFTLDGVSKVSSFAVHPQDNAYSFAIFQVANGSHNVYSDVGFNAIAYGFGQTESYGYNAGTNIKDFTPVASFQNPLGRIDSAVTCINMGFSFSVPLTFVPASIKWDFSAAPNISPNTTVTPSTITADSSVTANGRTLNYYSPHSIYIFRQGNTAALRDTIKLYTTSSTPDGCGSTDQMFAIPVTVRPDQPQAKFAVDAGGCTTDAVKFINQSTVSQGALKLWFWDFGDGSGSNPTDPNPPDKVYNTAGVHTIKLRVGSDIGCASSDATQSIEQTVKPVAKFTTGPVKCANADVTFTDASTTTGTPIAKWIWSLNDGNGTVTNTTNASITTKFTSDGVKNPTLKVASASGCESDAYAPAFSLTATPVVGFILPEVCLSDAFAEFIDTTKISDGSQAQFRWAWSFNAGTPAVTPAPSALTSTQQNPQVKYNKADNYKVSLTVTSANGCMATATQDFTVNGSIPQSVFEFANTAPYCGTKAVQIKNKSIVDFGNITKLEIYWDFANNPTVKETIETPVFNAVYQHSYADPTAPKPYTVKVVAFSGGAACSDGSSKSFTLYPQPKAAFSASATQLCFGETLNFTDKSDGVSSSIARWSWDLGKGTTSILQSPSKQYNDSGLFAVKMYFYNTDGCISDTATTQLTVYPNPHLILKHTDRVLEGGQISLKPDFVFGNQLTYLWTPPRYLSSDTALAPVSIPSDDITYKLTLTAQGGCTVSDTIFITVLKGPEVPNAFSPNGDGINDTWKIKYLDGYPDATVEVYSRSGQVVFRQTGYSKEWNGTYNNNPLPVGTYYYIINPKNTRPIITGSVTIIK